MPATNGRRIVPGKRARIIGPSVSGLTFRLGETRTIKEGPNVLEHFVLDVNGENCCVFPLSSLAPIDDEPEAGKGFEPGDEVWVKCRFGDYSTLTPGRAIVFGPWDVGIPHSVPLSDLRKA